MIDCAKRGVETVSLVVRVFHSVVRMRTTVHGFGTSYVKYVTMVLKPPSLESTMMSSKAIIPL